MSKAVAAAVGALAIQIFSGLAPTRATWNWTQTTGQCSCDVSTDGPHCTVVPHSGMSCDVSTDVQNDAAVAASNNETVPCASTSSTMMGCGLEEEAWMQIERPPPKTRTPQFDLY